ADGSKLSKRHGAQTVAEFRELGYLPEALVNFLAFLGWSPGTEEEIFTLVVLRERMTFERLQSSPAILDQRRLDYLNGVWIRRLTVEDLATRLRGYLPQASEGQRQQIAAMVQTRIKRLSEVPELVAFAFSEPRPDAATLRGRLSDPQPLTFLTKARDLVDGDADSLLERLQELSHQLVDDPEQLKAQHRAFMQVLRVAITGQMVSPPLPESIALIGREAALRRIDRALRQLQGS
ncbi:MAG: glutamate--tRNA ligase family protein, partial [Candidatus Dormibacteria bacterium]